MTDDCNGKGAHTHLDEHVRGSWSTGTIEGLVYLVTDRLIAFRYPPRDLLVANPRRVRDNQHAIRSHCFGPADGHVVVAIDDLDFGPFSSDAIDACPGGTRRHKDPGRTAEPPGCPGDRPAVIAVRCRDKGERLEWLKRPGKVFDALPAGRFLPQSLREQAVGGPRGTENLECRQAETAGLVLRMQRCQPEVCRDLWQRNEPPWCISR